MKYNIPLRAATERIANRQEFKASSVVGYNCYDGTYQVKSYSTVIAEYKDGVWYVNATHYSVTTSKAQHQVRMALHGLEYVTVIHVPYGASTLQGRSGPVALERANRIRVGA